MQNGDKSKKWYAGLCAGVHAVDAAVQPVPGQPGAGAPAPAAAGAPSTSRCACRRLNGAHTVLQCPLHRPGAGSRCAPQLLAFLDQCGSEARLHRLFRVTLPCSDCALQAL